MICGAARLRRNGRFNPALRFSRRIDSAGYSANVLNGADVLNRQRIQIALAKGNAVFTRIGKIATACQSKPRSGAAFDDRAADRQRHSDSNDGLLRHFDFGHFDLARLVDAKISKTRTALNSNGREASEFGRRQAGEVMLRFYLAQYCRGPEYGWYVQSDVRKDW